ncbi:PHD finger protein 20-like isoform X3 [Paramormyrops kingsleyae]|uniref:PHD finger protein 20, b n=2 Tax=Paramormyrops kingsleyae TaxID=1676925 RepID=A0A3B3RVV1_9TELE|nr:PHD finger protein 20-like isoform X1 [Paramormyrops kingsleyae]XP_023652494.1 PHD finger protein 20-like isoform X1 [Paramormyrops kingsleyae]
MSKTPPNRRGITFEVGAQLEARDSLKNWYAANIEKIDYEDEKVLIHYRQWSHRYDEWFDWASPYLRPVERIQLRREGLQDDCPIPGFHVNDKVLASWSDCRFYPAKVIAVNRDASYTVKFYDGVIQTVKGIHVKPFIRERKGGRSRASDRSQEKPPSRRAVRSRQGKPVENGQNQRGRPSSSDQDQESESEEDEEEEDGDDGRERSEDQPRGDETAGKRERGMKRRTSEGETRGEQRKRRTAERKRPTERSRELESEGVALSKEESAVSERRAVGEVQGGGSSGEWLGENSCTESKEASEEANMSMGIQACEEGGAQGTSGEDMHQEAVTKVEDERGDGKEEDKEAAAAQCHPLGRRTRHRLSTARWAENADGGVLELRKRRISLGQSTPSKRSKSDAAADKDSTTEPKPAEPPSKGMSESGPDPAPPSSASTTDSKEGSGDTGQWGEPSHPRDGEAPAPPAKVPVRRQANNPNRFSREPLYRVIKNQPPPVLFINLDHNPFKCEVPNCLKSFRKAKLLHYHMKYYHSGDAVQEGALSPGCGINTRASDKQSAGALPKSPKRRRTVSASMHSSMHSPHRTPQSPRGGGKASIRPVEKRRTSAPPAVHMQNTQRTLLREKIKENHVEKAGRRPQERDRGDIETALLKPREDGREKKHDFLRIKLKKKKKKKKKSKSAYTGSEENIDISLFGFPPKLSLSHKLPPSHKHKFESHGCGTGQLSKGLIRVDVDEASGSDWSSDSLGWSEDEVELDVTTPSQDLAISMAMEDSDIVRCVCEVEEENDFMVQCEDCLCWQHGVCMGLLEESVPGKYACYICRDPPGQRQSQRYWCDRDWLSSGHMYGLPFLEENYSHQNAKKIAATHQLLGDVHRVAEVLSGLQLKMSVLQSQTSPDLKMWRQPWRQAEKPKRRSLAGGVATWSPLPSDVEEKGGAAPEATATDRVPPRPLQASYISSEHCYQKPCAYYPAGERRLVVETWGGSPSTELERGLLSTEEPLERECGTAHGTPDRARHGTEEDGPRWMLAAWAREESVLGTGEPAGGAGCLPRQWQNNLLDHIEAVQDEVTNRMDFIERELDVLESWLDYTGELEPPEPLARLPQLKRRIKQLLCELTKVQQIAHCCST